MKSFKLILKKYVRTEIVLGSDAKNIKAEQLRNDLEKLQKKNNQYFWIFFGIIILAFCLSVGIVFLLKDKEKIALLLGILGFSNVGLIGKMKDLWKEKVAIDLTLILINNLKSNALESILPIILAKF